MDGITVLTREIPFDIQRGYTVEQRVINYPAYQEGDTANFNPTAFDPIIKRYTLTESDVVKTEINWRAVYDNDLYQNDLEVFSSNAVNSIALGLEDKMIESLHAIKHCINLIPLFLEDSDTLIRENKNYKNF